MTIPGCLFARIFCTIMYISGGPRCPRCPHLPSNQRDFRNWNTEVNWWPLNMIRHSKSHCFMSGPFPCELSWTRFQEANSMRNFYKICTWSFPSILLIHWVLHGRPVNRNSSHVEFPLFCYNPLTIQNVVYQRLQNILWNLSRSWFISASGPQQQNKHNFIFLIIFLSSSVFFCYFHNCRSSRHPFSNTHTYILEKSVTRRDWRWVDRWRHGRVFLCVCC